MYDILPTDANLHRWGLASQPDCPLCQKVQTLDHVLSSCPVALGQGRFTWRHNCVLGVLQSVVAARIGQASSEGVLTRPIQSVRDRTKVKKKSVKTKVNHRRLPRVISRSGLRPDLVVISFKAKRVVIVELTVPYEVRVLERHEYKVAKYEDLCADVRRDGFKVDFFAVEVGARGFIASSTLSFVRWLGGASAHQRGVIQRLSKAAEDSSYWIWCQRNISPWQNKQPGAP